MRQKETASLEAAPALRQSQFNYPAESACNQEFSEGEPRSVTGLPHNGAPSRAPAEDMDLTGVEPAPATLTECCAAITPQAHSGDATQSKA